MYRGSELCGGLALSGANTRRHLAGRNSSNRVCRRGAKGAPAVQADGNQIGGNQMEDNTSDNQAEGGGGVSQTGGDRETGTHGGFGAVVQGCQGYSPFAIGIRTEQLVGVLPTAIACDGTSTVEFEHEGSFEGEVRVA